MTDELAAERRRYLIAFGAAFGLGILTRVLSLKLDEYAGQHPPKEFVLFGLACALAAFGAAVWFSARSYKLARKTGSGVAVGLAFSVFALVPLLNFVSVFLLLRRCRVSADPS